MAKTGVSYDLRMMNHKCPWDFFPETPERLSSIFDKLENEDIIKRCIKIEPRFADPKTEITLCHPSSFIDKLSTTSEMTNEELEAFCSNYEDMYLCAESYKLALLSAGTALQAMSHVLENKCDNSMALIRPPGHHAAFDKPCGFCIFNNVAICAKTAVHKFNLSKVLIVDFDVHAAQGTQYCIQDDPRICLISFHRYENGEFWPNLPESNWDYEGNTINIPLNKIGLGDTEYLSAFHHIVLPLISQFNPQLILISAGYDAAYGDSIESDMSLTPASYGHMTRQLMSFAGGKVCALLEGGYFTKSLELGVLWTLKALLGDCLPPLKCEKIDISMSETILNVIGKQRKKFSVFEDTFETINLAKSFAGLNELEVPTKALYIGKYEFSVPYPTRGEYRPRDQEVDLQFEEELCKLLANYEVREPNLQVVLASPTQRLVFPNCIILNEAEEAGILAMQMIDKILKDEAKFGILFTTQSDENIAKNINHTHKRILKLLLIIDQSQITVQFSNDDDLLGTFKITNEPSDLTFFLHQVILPIGYELAPNFIVFQLNAIKNTNLTNLAYVFHQLNILACGKMLGIFQLNDMDAEKKLLSMLLFNKGVFIESSNISKFTIQSVANCWYQLKYLHCFDSLLFIE